MLSCVALTVFPWYGTEKGGMRTETETKPSYTVSFIHSFVRETQM